MPEENVKDGTKEMLERVVAMGFDTPQELERLEEIARAKKESEGVSQEMNSMEMNTSPESHEGAMM